MHSVPLDKNRNDFFSVVLFVEACTCIKLLCILFIVNMY